MLKHCNRGFSVSVNAIRARKDALNKISDFPLFSYFANVSNGRTQTVSPGLVQELPCLTPTSAIRENNPKTCGNLGETRVPWCFVKYPGVFFVYLSLVNFVGYEYC